MAGERQQLASQLQTYTLTALGELTNAVPSSCAAKKLLQDKASSSVG